jgi:hypothetical protein
MPTHPQKPRSSEDESLMLDALLRNRLSNYGYDHRSWRRLVCQRYRARREIRRLAGRGQPLHWDGAPLARRIDWARLDYVVGQSQNEEITNLLRQLANPEARWLS